MPDNPMNMESFAALDLDELSLKLINYLGGELGSGSVDYHEPLIRLTGGYETFICRFRLSGVDEHLSKPLVLRVYPENSHPDRAIMESIVQNAMADLGGLVPVVYFTCTDKTVLGNAFIIMDYFEGDTLEKLNLPLDQIVDILGKAHAQLHGIDSEPIIKKITESGLDRGSITFEGRLEALHAKVNLSYPWLKVVIEWLVENRPNNPEGLSVCHGDFHPMNLLFRDGNLQAVLDWPNFLIGDPAMDVAFTLVLIFPGKLLFPDLDMGQIKELYLSAYRKTRPLDETNMAYYSAFRGVRALMEGAEGQAIWGHPEIVQLLVDFIYETTNIKIKKPS
jgi:aminoglycoside phosphotransferase (APT) family kinase protein